MITLSKQPNFSLLLSHPAHFLSLGMGAGLAKKAPGTFGTLLAFPLYYFIQYDSYEVQWMVIAVLFVLGVYTCDVTGKALGVSDHGSIVWDEIVAMMLVLTVSPAQWQWHFFAFLLFRLFDIWKPFPIRQFDMHLKGGLGVMFDDLLAALYAIAVIQGVIWIN